MKAEMATPRARAAWGYSQLGQRALALKTNGAVKYDRLRAILSPLNSSDVSLEELRAIAEAAGVPTQFMESGYTSIGGSREDALQQAVRTLSQRVQALEGLQFSTDQRAALLALALDQAARDAGQRRAARSRVAREQDHQAQAQEDDA